MNFDLSKIIIDFIFKFLDKFFENTYLKDKVCRPFLSCKDMSRDLYPLEYKILELLYQSGVKTFNLDKLDENFFWASKEELREYMMETEKTLDADEIPTDKSNLYYIYLRPEKLFFDEVRKAVENLQEMGIITLVGNFYTIHLGARLYFNQISIENIKTKLMQMFRKKPIVLKLRNEKIKVGSKTFYTRAGSEPSHDKGINVVFAIDDKYVEPCATTIVSILANSSLYNFYNFYILNIGLTEENKRKLYSLRKKRDFGLFFRDVSNFDFSNLPLNRDWISATTYYRLYLPDVLPQDMHKCIYMDCDMLAEDDLALLWFQNIDDCIAGVVEDESSRENAERLNLPPEYKYFNAGMIMFNMDKLREFNLTEKAMDYYAEHKEQITMQDQDILNGVLNGKCKYLPLRWNIGSPAYTGYSSVHYYTENEEREAALNPGIVHFTGAYKPWQLRSLHPLNSEYKEYLMMTGFEEEIKKCKRRELFSKIVCKKASHKEEKIYLFGIRIYRHDKDKNTFFENIFSIKNDRDKSHKVISIMGIKLKVKRK